MNNSQPFLLDNDFLKQVNEWHEKEIHIKIISLDFNENPRSEIEGYATGGSVKVDGSSAVRRVCSVNMLAEDVNITAADWALESKFKLQIGLRNFIDSKYDDILWFPLGTYVITSFATTVNNSGINIAIQGRDKMCLLDGSIGGNIFASHDFGKLEIRKNDEFVEFEHILIYDIIKNAIHEYAGEPYQNIIINDLEDCSVELLEYRAKNKKIMFYKTLESASSGVYSVNMAFEGTKVFQELSKVIDGVRVEVDNYIYERIKEVGYGDTIGYRLTDLTYAGDLILGAGSTITQMLDKIIQMLGEFEYYYDLDGRFVFQRKKIYYNVNWTNAITRERETYYDSVENGSASTYEFNQGLLIESYNNKPNLANIKNDYSVWGKIIGASGNQLPAHLRCAIDDKPQYYYPLINGNDGTELWATQQYIVDDLGYEIKANKICDWRELIYQMGIDYMQSDAKINEYTQRIANNLCETPEQIKKLEEDQALLSKWEQTWNTNYVSYYTDLVDNWRQLYDITNMNWSTNYFWNPDFIICIREYNYNLAPEGEKGNYKFDIDLQQWVKDDNGTHNIDYNNFIDKIELINHKKIPFWFDFVDDSYLEKYKISNIGRRPKVVNDTEIKAIFFEEIPNILFVDPNNIEPRTDTSLSYAQLNLIGGLTNYIQISTQGKSAKEVLDNLIYTHTYYQESITLNSIPIYYLQPNTRISIHDERAGINGEYILKSYNLQLAHGGSMSIVATKAEEMIL